MRGHAVIADAIAAEVIWRNGETTDRNYNNTTFTNRNRRRHLPLLRLRLREVVWLGSRD